MTLPTPTTYGTITGKFVLAALDSADGDSHPDAIPAVGTVTFSPSVDKVAESSATPPTIILMSPMKAQLDSNGAFSVELVATDNSNTSPTGFVYTVTCAFLSGPNPPAFNISVPGGATTDLTSLMSF